MISKFLHYHTRAIVISLEKYSIKPTLISNCNGGHNILRSFDVLQNYFSSEVKVKGGVIASNKNERNELPHEMLNDLIFRSLQSQKILGKSQICMITCMTQYYNLVTSVSPKINILLILVKSY